jgi:hypothetical protein
MYDYSHYTSEILLKKKLNIIEGTLNTIKTSLTTSLDNGSFNSYKEQIIIKLDNTNEILQNLYMDKSIYKLVKDCSREEISNYIVTSDIESIENCLGQIEIHATEYCNIV